MNIPRFYSLNALLHDTQNGVLKQTIHRSDDVTEFIYKYRKYRGMTIEKNINSYQ